ncbi:uncharacterized protein AB675_2353 [Cyphellophora attinorum]|uniref:Protein ZIP4 homolog n=1 Tax=Cyphellophora attinorum TaxID=1664694 RepID=A0A0N1P408_9EURO|nr:uncharacterized protein AB675_2353 [Phialophora attinorum]KPI44836.1 hypothetical protein AB675_2353 [Phialophora attinorum]
MLSEVKSELMKLSLSPAKAVRKARAILDQSESVDKYLLGLSNDDHYAFPDLELCLQSLPLRSEDVSSEERSELHSMGLRLWNACCGLDRDVLGEKDRANKAKVRAFASLLLESAWSRSALSMEVHLKALNIGCLAARACLAHNDVPLANKVVETVAPHDQQIQIALRDDMTKVYTTSGSSAVVFVLTRIALAWKQERLDLANHFYQSLYKSDSTLPNFHDGRAADLCLEIGVDLLDGGLYSAALEWLERAKLQNELAEGDAAVDDPEELRLNILHATVRALMGIGSDALLHAAQDTLDAMKRDFGQRLPVLLLEIEMMQKSEAIDVERYSSVLLTIVRTVYITGPNHKLIMYHIHQLKALSDQHAYDLLKQYTMTRLVPDYIEDYIESAIVVLCWLGSATESTFEVLPEELDALHKARPRGLRADAANAAVLVLGKIIEGHNAKSKLEQIISYCRAALNPLFAEIGDRNRARIQRTMIDAQIRSENLQTALTCWDDVADAAKKDASTVFLRFRMAVAAGDDAGTDTFGAALVNCADTSADLLMSCATEMKQTGSLRRAAWFMQRALEKLTGQEPPHVNFDTILYSTARLHLGVLEENIEQIDYEVLSMLCSVFRTAANHHTRGAGRGDEKLLPDVCEWFEKAGFNAALKHAKQWPTKYTIDLLEHCTVFSNEVSHLANVLFLQAMLYATAARQCIHSTTIEDIPRTSYHAREPPQTHRLRHHLYKQVLHRYHRLKSMFDPGRVTEGGVDLDIQGKAADTLVMAFEAQVFLCKVKIIDGLPASELSLLQLIDDIPKLTESLKAHACVGDLVLSATLSQTGDSGTLESGGHLPLTTAIALIARLLTLFRERDCYTTTQAARWIRCIVQLVLDVQPPVSTSTVTKPDSGSPNTQATLTTTTSTTVNNKTLDILSPVVAESISIARAAAEAMSVTNPLGEVPRRAAAQNELYPADELQWLATTLFNLAVDLHFANQPDLASQWARGAIELADILALYLDGKSGGSGPGAQAGGGRGLAQTLRKKAVLAGWVMMDLNIS